MTCQEVQALIASGEVYDSVTEEAIKAHFQECPICRRDWEAVEQLAEQWESAPINEPHLTNKQVIELSEYTAGAITATQRKLWKHVLHCDSCYAAVGHLRSCLHGKLEPASAHVSLSSKEIWEVWRTKQRNVTLFWVGAAIALKTSQTRRAMKSRRGGENEPVEITEVFGPYQLNVRFRPSDIQRKKCKMELTLTSNAHETSVTGVIATLSHAGEERQSLEFQNPIVHLPAHGPGEYQLTLTHPNGEMIGVVNLQINEE
jgi:hypothetical protein